MKLTRPLELARNAGTNALTAARDGAAKGQRAVKRAGDAAARAGKDAAELVNTRATRMAHTVEQTIRGLGNVTAEGIGQIINIAAAVPQDETPEKLTKRDVFIIHGHDEAALDDVKGTLKSWGLNPISLKEQAGALLTIKEKFEKHAYSDSVGFAIALFTPDDECISTTDDVRRKRARQNVVFELGFFLAAFRGQRTCILLKGEVEMPSDMDGVSFIDMDARDWKASLEKELRLAGVKVTVRRRLKAKVAAVVPPEPSSNPPSPKTTAVEPPRATLSTLDGPPLSPTVVERN